MKYKIKIKEIIMDVKRAAIKKIRSIFHQFGIEISKYETEANRARKQQFDKWETLAEILIINLNRRQENRTTKFENDFIKFIADNFRKSKSQIFQDLLVLFLLEEKEHGYFVEFGATNGISFSNTYLLEKGFHWKGVLAEPGRVWHKDLAQNRDCRIDRRCVWDISDEHLQFNETECAELSTVNELTKKDSLAIGRINNKKYLVETVSLNELLMQSNAPASIDFMSIDTEGSELRILSQFNFNKYRVNVICVEHNFSEPDRADIYELLVKNGFERVFTEYSYFDDWYVNSK
ncbi:FkbM family methyltransferase [Burkholderiaceae bacterium]|nr:FkbM family methyltransferase [Burkholderiaceae bacterium]